MQYPNYGNIHAGGHTGVGNMAPGTSQRREESFQSQATVFILKDKTWREQSQGLVQFVFDLNTYALRLIISPGQADEMDRRLRPRIRSKGPRAYVVRAQAPNNGEDSILAVRFEREEDSQNFRKFVEKRDVDNNTTSQHPNGARIPSQHNNPNAQAAAAAAQGYNQQNYPPNNMYPNMGGMMAYPKQGPAQYENYYRPNENPNYNNYYPSPSPQGGAYGSNHEYRGTATSTMANPATTPHNGSTHQSLYSSQNAYGANNPSTSGGALLHRPSPSHNNNQWNQSPNPNVGPPYGTNEGAPDISYGGNAKHNNNATGQVDPNGVPTPVHYSTRSGGPTATTKAHNTTNNPNDAPNTQPPTNVNVLKLTEANLELHNKDFAESTMANKRKNVRDIIVEQLQWAREHGLTAH